MQLRGRRMLFDVGGISGYFLVRLLLEHVQVEHSTAAVGKFRYKRHQHFFGNTASVSAMPASSGMSGNCSSFTTSWLKRCCFRR